MNDPVDWPNRSLVFQTHRGDKPQLYHHFALHNGPWKLVHPSGFGKEKIDGEVKLELYNLKQDPQQKNNLAADQPEVFARLKANYESWFEDVGSTRPDNYAPPRIIIGTDFEPQTVLTRQDWRHTQGKPWAGDSNGSWLLEAEKPMSYEIEIIFNHSPAKGKAVIKVGDITQTIEIPAGQKRGHVRLIDIPQGKTSLTVTADFDGKKQGPHQVILSRQ
jgi:arylsulfatase/arylsulfatase A